LRIAQLFALVDGSMHSTISCHRVAAVQVTLLQLIEAYVAQQRALQQCIQRLKTVEQMFRVRV